MLWRESLTTLTSWVYAFDQVATAQA